MYEADCFINKHKFVPVTVSVELRDTSHTTEDNKE